MAKNYRAELVGVFGDPVEGNPTGVVEEAAFAAKNLNYRYLTVKVTPDDFDDAMKSLKALHMKGINLTMPHKIAVLPYLDEISEAARIIGAVNTVNIADGRLYGDNTDGRGFVQALKNEGITPENKTVTILGAGGAAKAIAVECALAGASRVIIINRSEQHAQELVKSIEENTKAGAQYILWEKGQKIPQETQILINGTPVGLHPYGNQKPDIDYETIDANMVVSDVVFNPADTMFLQAARERGAKTISGLGKLACQGALNFTIWTGEEAPYEVMFEALKKEFEE